MKNSIDKPQYVKHYHIVHGTDQVAFIIHLHVPRDLPTFHIAHCHCLVAILFSYCENRIKPNFQMQLDYEIPSTVWADFMTVQPINLDLPS